MRASVTPAQSSLARETGAAPAIHAVTAESDSMAAFPAASFIAEPLTAATPTWKSFLADTIATFKLRVTTLVVMTAWAGYYLGATRSGINSFNSTLLDTLIGVALVSCGASALNQAEERRTDALMIRTRNRPLASRRLSLGYGVLIGMLAIISGSLWLVARTNLITGTLTLLTGVHLCRHLHAAQALYSMATFIGAFPGAMPPLIGWTAARGMIEWPAVALFAILFVWQFPHFMSIAWLYREDYATRRHSHAARSAARWLVHRRRGAGLRRSDDSRQPGSLLPAHGGTNLWVCALLLGLLYLAYTIRFTRITKSSASESRLYARDLLKVSVTYLPLLLAVLMLNATRRN